MLLSEKQKNSLRASTASAAKALVEDLEHIGEISNRVESSPAELRRLSAVIRRILVDEDLKKIAAPRLGQIKIEAPNNEGFYAVEKHARVLFFASGGAQVFGVTWTGLCLSNAGQPPYAGKIKRAVALFDSIFDDKERGTVALRLDTFLSQRVLCYMSEWYSRRDAIKYIANVRSGVHSGKSDDRTPDLGPLISTAYYRFASGRVEAHAFGEPVAFVDDPDKGPVPKSFPTTEIDPVLIEVLAAGVLMASSPQVQELEKIIRAE
jgi:hypothetical protein